MSQAKKKVVSQPRKVRPRPIQALLFFTLSALIVVSVSDYDSAQYHATNPTDPNLVGYFGSFIAFYGYHYLGVSVFLLPVFMFWFGVRLLIQQAPGKRKSVAISIPLSMLCASALLAMIDSEDGVESHFFKQSSLTNGFGGIIGKFIGPDLLEPHIGIFGTFLILGIGFLIGCVLIFSNNYRILFEHLQHSYQSVLTGYTKSRRIRKAHKAELSEAKRKAKKEAAMARAQKGAHRVAEKVNNLKPDTGCNQEEDIQDRVPSPIYKRKPSLLSNIPGQPLIFKEEEIPDRFQKPGQMPSKVGQTGKLKASNSTPEPGTIKIISGEKTEKSTTAIPERRGDFVFPGLELLSEAPNIHNISPEDHAETMQALIQTLEQFGVKVIPGDIYTGPVITRYEVVPAPGVRVEKIAALDKNIALGLKAMSVRILAPVPGKGAVGIEVPNRMPQAVCMREIVESKAWADANAEIPIVLGKDVTGKPMVTDLTKMPHVLIAGSTGSGKTVCINAIIASLLYHSGPRDLRFIMVDPKVVEMQMYNALPHMLIPVVTEPKKVPGALKWLISEMEHRYQIFAKTNVRNIAGFNAKITKNKQEQAQADAMDAEMSPEERAALQQIEIPRDEDAFEISREKLPYIVCIIDELADLMMVAPADIETAIARIAQLARAAGIHLILATQRPSVNVITGVIKANLPSRISFKVASKVDSRTILDGGGAEALIGKGDMLFIPPGTSTLIRAQGAFVADHEINAIVEFLRENNEPPEFAKEVQKQIDAVGEEDTDENHPNTNDQDELLPQAIDVLRSTKRASTSMLQRRLRIGYNRAARLMEALEDSGIVGPENGSNPREIIVDLDSM